MHVRSATVARCSNVPDEIEASKIVLFMFRSVTRQCLTGKAEHLRPSHF